MLDAFPERRAFPDTFESQDAIRCADFWRLYNMSAHLPDGACRLAYQSRTQSGFRLVPGARVSLLSCRGVRTSTASNPGYA